MSITFKKLLLTGTAIVAVAYSVQAQAATVTIGTTGSFTLVADPNATPGITFTADGTLAVNDGVNITNTGTITSNAANQGTLTLSGTTTVAGVVGVGNALKIINAGAAGKTATFSSAVNAQTINVTGTGNVVFGGNVAGDLVYGADGTVTINADWNGAVTTAANNTGTLTLASNSFVTGNVGATGKVLKVINVGANGSGSTFLGTVDTQAINVTGTGTVDFEGSVTGALVSYAADGVILLGNNVNLSGAVVTATNNTGDLTLAGNSLIGANVGAAGKALKVINVGADGSGATFYGAVNAKTVKASGMGVANFLEDITGDIDFANHGAGFYLAAGKTISGNVDSTGGSAGYFDLLGGFQTLNGNIGATHALTLVRGGANGAVTTFNGTVAADDLTFLGAGTIKINNGLVGNVGFYGNNGQLVLAAGKNITGAVDNIFSDGHGTLTLVGGAQTVGGAIGATKSLSVLNVGATGAVSTLSGKVNADTINVTGTGNVAFNGNVTGALIYGGDGTVTLGFVALTGPVTTATDNTGTLTLSNGSNLSTSVGAAGKALKVVNVGATGKIDYIGGTVTATTITAIGDGTTFFYNGIVGNVDFAGNNADFSLGSDTTVAGTVDSTGSAGGNLYLLGGVQTLAGTVGATKALTSVGAGADSAAVSTFSSIVNSGSLEFEGAGKINLNGVGANKIGLVNFLGNAGTLAVGAGVDLMGNIDDTTSTSMGTVTFAGASTIGGTIGATGLLKALTLNGTGTTVSVGGNTKAADTTTIGGNTLAVTGTFTAAAAQTLAFDITGAATNGKITTTGNVVMNSNTVVALTLNTGGAYIANNQQFTLIDDTNNNAGGGVGTLVAGKLTGSTALLTFTQVADTSDLIIKATRVGISTLATTENGQNVGVVLDSAAVTGSADPTLVLVEGNLANAGSTGALGTLLDSLTPRADDGAYTAAFEVVLQVQDINDTRIASLRSGETGMAAGSSSADTGLWFQAYGQSATQDMRSSIAGYDSSTIGGAMGVDTARLLDHGIVGLAFNYGRTTVDSNNANTTSTDVDSYGLNLYGSREIMSQAFVTGQVGYAYNSINSERHNVGGTGLTAAADYSSDQYSAKVAVGRDYAVQSGMTLTPSVSAAYTYLDTASFTESGAGGANLSVNSDSMNRLDLGVGVVAGWKLKVANDGAVLKPTLHVGYAYDALGDRVQTTSNFTGAGASFATQGFEPARSRGDIGAGLSLVTAQNWDLSANYDYEVKSDYDAHSGYVRATTHF
jgi:outer membrane autotransporter protein